jgi:hypothetical protein
MTKKRVWIGTCSAVVGLATAAITAQTPSPSPAQSGTANTEQNIVVTGCLTAAPSSPTDASAAAGTAGTAGTTGTTGTVGATGTTGTAGAPSTAASAPTSEAKFLLTKASIKPADAAGAAGATSAPAAPEASPSTATQTYRLVANAAALSPLVGKKLELTGTLDQDNANRSSSDPSAGPALRVKSGKIIAESCSQ